MVEQRKFMAAPKIQTTPPEKGSREEVLSWLAATACTRIAGIVGVQVDSLETVELAAKESIFKEFWSTSILIVGDGFNIKCRVFFRSSRVKKLIPKAILKKKSKEELRDFSVDFIKEFCNHAAGHLKSKFEKVHMYSAISIPTRARALDILFEGKRHQEIEKTYELKINGLKRFLFQVQLQGTPQALASIVKLSEQTVENAHQGAEDLDMELF